MSVQPNDTAGRVHTIAVSGDILSTNAEKLRTDIYTGLKSFNALKSTVVMDIRQASMVDSVGLNLLVSIIKHVKGQGGSVRFIIGNTNVERTFRFTRLDSQAELTRV